MLYSAGANYTITLEKIKVMRLVVLFLLVMSQVSICLAQEKKVVPQLYVLDAIKLGDSAFIVVQTNNISKPTRLGLQFFDFKTQKLKSETFVNLERRGIEGTLEAIYPFQNKLVLLYSLYYPGPKRNHLLYETYHLPDLVKEDSGQVGEAYTPDSYRVPFGYHVSPDKSKLLFFSWSYAVPTDPAKLMIQVYDQDYQLLWKKRYVLPYKNETLYLYGCKVTDDGHVFILGEDYQGKVTPNMRVDLTKIKRFALFVERESNDFLEYVIDLKGDDQIADLEFTFSEDNQLIGAGYYRYKKKVRLEGVFTLRIDPKTKQSDLEKFPITKEAYQQHFAYADKESFFSDDRKDFTSYYVDDIKITPDGGMVIFSEQRIEDNRAYNLLSSDIYVHRVDGKALSWSLRIPKRQLNVWGSVNPAFSYGMVESGPNYYLFFNDDQANHQLTDNPSNFVRRFDNTSRAVQVMAQLTPEGQFRKTLYVDQKNPRLNNQLFIPSISWQITPGTFMMYTEPVNYKKSLGRFVVIREMDYEF